jgi:predicted site-specific integrase-resolvase
MQRKIKMMKIVRVDLPKSFETERVADIMPLMTSFTATLHSRRKRQSKRGSRHDPEFQIQQVFP